MAQRHLAILTISSLLALLPVDPAWSKPAGSATATPAPTTSAVAPKPESPKQDPKSKTDSKTEKVQWLTFDDATGRAAKEDKHIIVDIYTNWCGWCKVMERQTYGNPEVAAYLKEHFLLAKVNGEASGTVHWQGKELTERQLARALGVNGYPATYFLKPNADLLGGVSGYIEHPDFLIYARYVHTRWYEKGKIQDYADSLRSSAQ